MKSNDIMADARVMQVRELKRELASAKERLAAAESERDILLAHCSLGLVALRDFEGLSPQGDLKGLSPQGKFRIIDGWNVLLRRKNVSKMTKEQISSLKKEYLESLGVNGDVPSETGGCTSVDTWVVFDGQTAGSFRSGRFRVTYTGGTGPHRADRLITDFVNAAKVLGLDTSRIVVETADKDLIKRLSASGVEIAADAVENGFTTRM